MLKFTNNASATLAGSITSTATSVVLTAGNGSLFPALGAGDYCFATLVDSSNNLEIVKITARSGDTLTVVRGQDNTTARGYSAGDKCELRLVAAVFNETVQRDGSIDFTGQITVPQGTAAGKAINASRQILTSSNLTGGGDLTADRTLDLSDTGVVAGSFGSASQIPVITVDAKGRITSRSTAALDLSTKVDLNGANATGTWGGTTEWTRVNNRPTALSQFSNNLGNYGAFIDAASGSGSQYGNFSPHVTSVSLSKSGTTALLSVGTACNCNCNC